MHKGNRNRSEKSNVNLAAAALASCGLVMASAPQAHEWTGARPDGHAPIGVMGEHTHKEGEWMMSYRFMRMSMDENYVDSDSVSTAEVLQNYMVAPLEMDMDMHMFGFMYASSDQVTWMLMLPYIDMTMDHVNRMGRTFTTETSGIGDIKASALYTLVDDAGFRAHLNLGVSFPTGSIDETDITLGTSPVQLPYPMQLGSGTFDLLPGMTLSHQLADWSWGGQASFVIRTGENDRDYTLGDRFKLTSWAARVVSPSVSVSARMSYEHWDDIDGADSELNPMMVPTARTDLRAGERTDLFLGGNYYIREGALKGHRIALEIGKPVHQDLDGPQLATDTTLVAGWQLAF